MANVVTEYVGDAKNGVENKINPRWWEVDEDQIYAHLYPLVEDIDTRQSYRRRKNVVFARMYSNLDPSFYDVGYTYRTPYVGPSVFPSTQTRPTLNVVKACIDTIASRIAKSKPRPMFLTDGGDWSSQRKAEKLTKFFDGQFKMMNFYEQKQKSFVDAQVYGTGAVKFYKDTYSKTVACERVMIDELIVDDYDGMYGDPSQLFQMKYISKDQLKAKFPKYAFKIDACPTSVQGSNSMLAQNMIRVIEAWKKADNEGQPSGFHSIVISNCTLVAEQYDKAYFPFVFDRWTPKLAGFYGMGVAEEIAGIQLEINTLLNLIEQAQHLACVPRVWVELSSEVNTKTISNQIGTIGKYRGTPPMFQTSPGMSPEVYQHLQYLYQKAFEIVGISQMNASGTKPSGLDSGAAIREYQDVQADRFSLCAERYDETFLQATTIVSDLMNELGDVKVKLSSGKYAETLNWRDVKMDKKDYVTKVYPTAALPTLPAAKLQTIQEYVQAGFMDVDTAKSLLQFPDIESYMNYSNSKVELVKMMIEKMIDDGQYQSPEPYMDLAYALQLTQSAYLYYRMQSVPEDRLDLLRDFMSEIQTMMTPPAPPAAPGMPIGPMPPGMPASPLAAPEAPPTSDLIPNVPQ